MRTTANGHASRLNLLERGATVARVFDPDRLEELGRKLRADEPRLTLTFHPDRSASPLSEGMERVAQALARGAARAIHLRRGDGEGVPALPALTLERAGRGVIHYLALPEEREERPFGELVTGEALALEARAGELASLTKPAELFVFVAAACPFCPEAVRAAHAVAFSSPAVTVTVVDCQRYAPLAERFGVHAAPTTLLDGEVIRSGVIPAPELASLILGRGGAERDAQLFTSRVAAGELDLAADSLLDGTGAAPFLALWRKSTTSSRIALMLLAERVIERAPRALAPVLPGLIELLATDDDALRGDTADLLGRTEDPAAHPALCELLLDPNPEIAEIAAEALGVEGTGDF